MSEAYEAKGLTQINEPVERYRSSLAEWATAMGEEPVHGVGLAGVLVDRCGRQPPPSAAPAKVVLVQSWVAGTAEVGPARVADSAELRQIVEQRVTKLRKGKSVLANPKLLGLWGGSSGASPLEYRWGTVRTLVLDVQEGLARAGT